MTNIVDAKTPEHTEFIKLCVAGLRKHGWYELDSYKDRLKLELKEINVQAEHEYFLDLHKKKLRFRYNENNLLVAVLLDLCEDVDLETPPVFVQGEFPDIDMDYPTEIQQYLKNDWAPQTFGRENVCSITAYGKLGIKSSILDMTSVHGLPKDEIQSITVTMEDKDDDDEILVWDKALELYPLFKSYCEKNEEVAEVAKFLIGRRKSASVHAGGLIISSVPISDFVPLEVRSVDKKNDLGIVNELGVIVAAWSEGQATQDLQPVGLVKFDVLVVDGLKQISLACELIKERHGIESISALPNRRNWSDTSYLNDSKVIELANRGDMLCCFQFGSEGIRKLVKKGGVGKFDDIPSFSALYRPGPLGMGMGDRFCLRKRGIESFVLHKLIEPILGSTYGVMVYQEQVMKILNVVGNIPLIHCEKIRKAISKKKIELFSKYKELFLINGQKNLGESLEFVQNLWEQIEAFADYGFNKSMTIGTEIATTNGIKEIQDFIPGDIVFCINEQGKKVETEVIALHDHGYLQGYEVTFDDGYQITCSMDHKFLTEKEQVSLRNICRTRSYILCDHNIGSVNEKEVKWMGEPLQSNLSQKKTVRNTSKRLCSLQRSANQEQIGEIQVYSKMWRKNVDKRCFISTSSNMRQMSSVSLEENNRDPYSSLWDGISYLERKRIAFKNMRRMQQDKTRKYSTTNGQVESRQFRSNKEENIFRYSSKDFYSSRFIDTTCRKSKKVAKGKSRKVCSMYRSCLEKSKTFSNGNLVKNPIRLEVRKNSLWRRSKASRFCKGQHLDRSRWLLSFLRTQKQQRTLQTSNSSSQRQNVKRGVYQKGRCDAFETKYGMFSQFNRSDEDRDLELGAGYAEITDTRNLVHRKIVRIVSVGKRHMFDLEVANPTHNFILPNGIVTSNSHSYAYSYITARHLYLKAHYPLEFYTAVLMNATKADKIKMIKLDAAKHGIEVVPVHINKSKSNFSIIDNKIYYGFSNLIGIGTKVAEQIEAGQPYKSFADFLNRFGTNADVIKSLISLDVFEDNYDRLTMYKFYEYFKDKVVKRRDCVKRYTNSFETHNEKLKALLESTDLSPELKSSLAVFENEEVYDQWTALCSHMERTENYKSKGEIKTRTKSVADQLHDIRKAYEKSSRNFTLKEKEAAECLPCIDSFNIDKVKLDLEDKPTIKFLDIINQIDTKFAEKEYYGFQWVHDLEESPDYSGLTIDKFLEEAEQGNIVGCIEIQIISCKKKDFKSGNGFAYDLIVEDSNGKEVPVRMWKDDYDKFKDDLIPGTLMKMRVKPPIGSFPSFNFESPARQDRWKLPKNRIDDYRIVLMRKGKPKSKNVIVDLTDCVL